MLKVTPQVATPGGAESAVYDCLVATVCFSLVLLSLPSEL